MLKDIIKKVWTGKDRIEELWIGKELRVKVGENHGELISFSLKDIDFFKKILETYAEIPGNWEVSLNEAELYTSKLNWETGYQELKYVHQRQAGEEIVSLQMGAEFQPTESEKVYLLKIYPLFENANGSFLKGAAKPANAEDFELSTQFMYILLQKTGFISEMVSDYEPLQDSSETSLEDKSLQDEYKPVEDSSLNQIPEVKKPGYIKRFFNYLKRNKEE